METKHYPPPWHLKGQGFILPFLGNKTALLDKGFISESDKQNFRGGLGAIMIVNYDSSNVGPYYELLFIPGDFYYENSPKKVYKKITKIFVSTDISIQEGRLNWAIPKEFANFNWIKKNNNTLISVESSLGEPILKAELNQKFFSFPLTTKIYPITLLQKSEDDRLISTQFYGSGYGKMSSILEWEANPKYFVDIVSISKFFLGISAHQFNITFPLPEILK
ncbi:MAG TPA: acetoacetate decarboxylase [Leptospiraceae bacterium]|nr:acetoacetate decarboxylase [Leptospiraceae bacterium]HMW07274.1 acetoacetate decarboxylase [Leptospiraceae bacterium]HMX33713.1 acetoacetate decarboxylase [Leptospiraceae bacterium]HMY32908.1 acetoacetate decarboxylase [Leptospiraceae bacterium]HMZ66630.1 acetoacetate decarboxylase [Leptospiraceae bacterium]